ncbi:hypothetical protein [Sodalis sp. dw_96]|uniref:hypothetical protein n=1 Tax=Sodalis sp. dw_96 TaxID=2719794 RepID=UPI001BD4C4E5|nr:hypothetical protein [Sodalis sp. dw_96]
MLRNSSLSFEIYPTKINTSEKYSEDNIAPSHPLPYCIRNTSITAEQSTLFTEQYRPTNAGKKRTRSFWHFYNRNVFNPQHIANEDRQADRLFGCVAELKRYPDSLSAAYGEHFIAVLVNDHAYYLQSKSVKLPGGHIIGVGYLQGRRVISLGEVYHIEDLVTPPMRSSAATGWLLISHLTQLKCITRAAYVLPSLV